MSCKDRDCLFLRFKNATSGQKLLDYDDNIEEMLIEKKHHQAKMTGRDCIYFLSSRDFSLM